MFKLVILFFVFLIVHICLDSKHVIYLSQANWQELFKSVLLYASNSATLAAFVWIFIEASYIVKFKKRTLYAFVQSNVSNKMPAWKKIKNKPDQIKVELGTFRSLIKGFKEVDPDHHQRLNSLIDKINNSKTDDEIKANFNELISDLEKPVLGN